MRISVPRAVAHVARLGKGVPLVSWRYLWSTTPLYRSTQAGDAGDCPPAAPHDLLIDPDCQPLDAGTGPLYHRLFAVDISGTSWRADELMAVITADLNKAVPAEVAAVEPLSRGAEDLHVGDKMIIRIPGPWNGPVRVVHHDATSFRLATLSGHMEAGQIEFRARGGDDRLRFEIETWARSATPVVHVLYTKLWLASEIQLNMWVRFCLSAARLAHGKPERGVTITTRVVDDARQLACCLKAERAQDHYSRENRTSHVS